MSILKRKPNNQGSTLVMVIVISLFVGIIAALVLALTMRNFESQKLKKEASGNFYDAEEVVDEIRTQLERYADQAAQEAYKAWLEQYSYMKNAEERKRLFYRVYENTLKAKIEEYFLNEHRYEEMFVGLTGGTVIWNDERNAGPQMRVRDTDDEGNFAEGTDSDGKFAIDGISITFRGIDGKATTITTDIALNIEYPGFRVFSASNERPASKYILIADGSVKNSISDCGIDLIGNIYSGGESALGALVNGISFFGEGTVVNIKADKVITRESFEVADGASVRVEGLAGSMKESPEGWNFWTDIWARNIALGYGQQKKTDAAVKVFGNTYVFDDLSMNADNSEFTLYGNYYGYSINNAKSDAVDRNGSPEGSSAIIINGKKVKLDLSYSENIWISGKAFISLNDFEQNRNDILLGESLTYRSLQSAYLVPGECMTGIGHNPMDRAEQVKFLTENGGRLDYKAYRSSTGIDLEYYLNSSNPCKPVTVRYIKNGKVHYLVYYYMNFRNHDKAQEFFSKYYEVNEKLAVSRMSMFEDGEILVNEAGLVNTGNVITYETADGVKTLNLTGRNSLYSEERVVSKESELNTKYEALVTTLDENNSGTSLSMRATDSIVKFSEVEKDLAGRTDPVISEPKEVRYGSTRKNYYLVIGKNVTIDSSKYSGDKGAIVIATGDVTVNGGITFNGLIIAGGDVILTGNGMKLENDYSKNEDMLISQFITQYPDLVGKYFVEDDGLDGDNGTVFSSDMITVEYDNWKKN